MLALLMHSLHTHTTVSFCAALLISLCTDLLLTTFLLHGFHLGGMFWSGGEITFTVTGTPNLKNCVLSGPNWVHQLCIDVIQRNKEGNYSC